MALTTGAGWGGSTVNVTTTATQVLGSSGFRREVKLKNATATAVTLFLGGPDLTSANTTTDGYPLARNEVLTLSAVGPGLSLSQPLYAVTASGTASLAILGGGA